MQGLDWQTLQIPLAAGLAQGQDARAMQPPGLTIAKDVQFDDLGGLQTRRPVALMSLDIFGGGTLSGFRTVVANGDELLCFTEDALYSWNAQLEKWVSKGTHLAIDVAEESRFVTTGDQITCDRAELNGTIVYAWVDAGVIYVGAIDKTTGSVLLAPTATSSGDSRPRLVALSTKILLFVATGDPQLNVYAIDPASPGTAIAGAATTVLAVPDFNLYYDAVRVPGADTAVWASRRTTTTSYSVGKVTAALAVTASTKARTCDGPIAVSCEPTGAQVQVVRGNGTNIQGDLITISSLADTAHITKAVGTCTGTLNQIAAAHRSVQNGGQHRCYAFWSSAETSGTTGFELKTNYVDTGGSLGTQSVLRLRLGVASRAFDYDGSVYVWGAFAGQSGPAGMGVPLGIRAQLQNAYFLYRDDGHLAASCAKDIGGGFSAVTGHLPGVAVTSGTTVYSWCATERRVIDLGGDHTGYSDRAPRDVVFEFDSNAARRGARLGRTMYVSGGLIIQYDGVNLHELGFLVCPWLFSSTAVGGGSIPAGAYSYKSTLRCDNAAGERERSTTACGEQASSAGGQKIQFQIAPLHITRRANAPAIEMWRTKVTPIDDSPFYLATSVDPAATGDNAYLANASTSAFTSTWPDNMTDAVLETKEQNPENGDVLENLRPPVAAIVLASDTRIFLAAVAGDPDRVWYSKQRLDGSVAGFHDQLAFDVPRAGGEITGLAFLNETLIVFRERAVYAVPGEGFDNFGLGQNFGPARVLAGDLGAVSQEAIGVTPKGIVFKSHKGWQLLNRGWAINYIGGPVSDYDGDTVVAVHVLEEQHQIRCLTSSRMLVLDYLAEQWAEWTIANGLSATVWRGTYVCLTTAGPATEQTAYSDLTYGWDVETAWIKLADLQGFGRMRWLELLAEYRSSCAVRIRTAVNYKAAYVSDRTWTCTPPTVGDGVQVRHSQKQQQIEAIKIRLTAVKAAIQATVAADTGYTTGPLALAGATTWGAVLEATAVGADGNGVTLIVTPKIGATRSIEVRDGQRWDPDTETWDFTTPTTVGIKLVATDNGGTSPATAAQIEAAIAESSRLLRVATPHASPSAQVDMSAMVGLELVASCGDTTLGVDADNNTPPTGEALKLTGLGIEVGMKRGLYKRLPAAAKQGA